jgi:hypothetical protein
MNGESHGLNESQFRFALFWTKNRLLIRKISFYFFLTLEISLILYAAYGAVQYFFLERESYSKMMKELSGNYTNFQSWHQKIEPKALIFGNAQIIPTTNRRYDFVVPVENVNDEWMIQGITFYFQFGAQRTDSFTTFVYPKQKKFLAALGQSFDVRPATAEFIVTDMRWLRVTDFGIFSPLHYDFLLENIRSDSLPDVNKDAKLSVNRVYFDITNKTAFDFWSVPVTVALLRGEQVVALSTTSVDNFLSFEKRPSQVNFFGGAGGSSSITIIPEVNVYDRSVYRPLPLRFEEEDEEEIKIYSKDLIPE